MDSPLRTRIDCHHLGHKIGSAVVIPGKPIRDKEGKVVEYTKRLMQVRRGSLKGKDCREFFDSVEQWNQSFGIYQNVDPPKANVSMTLGYILILMPLSIAYILLVAYAYTH
jgi:hypothetical protein